MPSASQHIQAHLPSTEEWSFILWKTGNGGAVAWESTAEGSCTALQKQMSRAAWVAQFLKSLPGSGHDPRILGLSPLIRLPAVQEACFSLSLSPSLYSLFACQINKTFKKKKVYILNVETASLLLYKLREAR